MREGRSSAAGRHPAPPGHWSNGSRPLQIRGAGYKALCPTSLSLSPSETHLVLKTEHAARAREMFANTGINITTEGKRHLGAVIGSRSYTEEYVVCKVENWSEEIKKLYS